ncbi:dynein associated protein-domain-containing protein [Morchella snyderi]|nr:dynein associated protein-domain-containing protein [Morchella snyderi]
MAEAEFLVGDHVDVGGYAAVVRYVGETLFAPGEWIGIEFEGPDGKNDGSVQGERYFNCPPNRGIFVKPGVPRLIERPPPPAMKRASAIVSPAHGSPRLAQPRPLSMRAPASPTKMLSGSPSPGAVTSRTGTPLARPPSVVGRVGTGTPTPRTSGNTAPRTGPMGPPGGKQTASATASKPGQARRQSTVNSTPMSRTPSVASSAGSSVARPPPGSNRLSLKPGGLQVLGGRKQSISNVSSERSSPDITSAGSAMRRSKSDDKDPRGQSTRMGRRESNALSPGSPKPVSKVAITGPTIGSPVTGPSATSAGAISATMARELEDLRSTIKVMEKKRTEDRDKLKALERIQNERDKFEMIIQKLQAKYQPQQAELVELRKEIKEMKTYLEEMEEFKVENEMIVEMATLDREMAEEQTESLRAELEAVRGRAEELEMEVEILREENNELSGEMTQEEKTSAGWLQMEKQNERLREALLRLRDMTSQTEIELKETIKSLEEDNNELVEIKKAAEGTRERLQISEAAVEDLRQQLETALGAEEMLEDLTERNLSMSEQIEELKATIEDLESLKEISDELEINHVETEKQMQEEIDYKDLVIGEQSRRIAQLDASNEEAEYTITRFRELVTNLQSDLEDMRASQQITETEAEELTARSRSMIDINMKLQITAAKAQNKTIDLELRRLEAEEAVEHLSIVQMFLPEAYRSERDSVLALLRFKRVAFKAHLLHTFVKERLAGQVGQEQAGHEESLMAACNMCDKLTWVSAMCDRFVNCISGCSSQQFARFQGALYELDPVERALNGWIEGLRKDDLKEKQCVAELQRTMALMSHLGEIHLKNDLEGFASDLHMRVLLMQSYMESTAAAMAQIKLMVQSKLPTSIEEGDSENDIASSFAKRADAIVSNSRSAKVIIGKILRSLNDFQTRSLSLTQDKLGNFTACEDSTKRLADYARAIGNDVYELLYSDDAKGNVGWQELQSMFFRTTERELVAIEVEIFGAFGKELKNLTNLLVELGSTASDIDMTAEFEKATAPWIVRAHELKTTKTISVDAEEEIRRLKDDILERATQIKLRDKTLEESAVKIELLESRMRNVTKQSERIEELEKLVSEGTIREKDLTDAIENLNEEIQSLETEVDKWKKTANDKRALGEVDRIGAEKAVATAREVDELKKEIASLAGAVNFLRDENARVIKNDLLAPDSWLFEPLLAKPEVKEVDEYEQALATEGQDVMAELMLLATQSRVVDLTKGPKNRKAWRPAKETPRSHYLEQRENYESLIAWKEEVTSKALYHDAAKKCLRPQNSRKANNVFGAKVNIKMPRLYPVESKIIPTATDVVIQEPDGWESLQETMGFA